MFRGFVYGGLLRIYHDRHWFFLALISSLLFAAAHLYYLFIYGIASLAPFIEITAIGTALSVAYYYSGGNLVVPAIIHGLFDASGFIAADISPEAGLALRQFLLWAGVLSAFVLLAHRRRRKNKPADLRMPDPFFAEKGDHDE
jgi:membrane protease YdiL (CAAX protease family)